jgi:hypothetical protein
MYHRAPGPNTVVWAQPGEYGMYDDGSLFERASEPYSMTRTLAWDRDDEPYGFGAGGAAALAAAAGVGGPGLGPGPAPVAGGGGAGRAGAWLRGGAAAAAVGGAAYLAADPIVQAFMGPAAQQPIQPYGPAPQGPIIPEAPAPPAPEVRYVPPQVVGQEQAAPVGALEPIGRVQIEFPPAEPIAGPEPAAEPVGNAVAIYQRDRQPGAIVIPRDQRVLFEHKNVPALPASQSTAISIRQEDRTMPGQAAASTPFTQVVQAGTAVLQMAGIAAPEPAVPIQVNQDNQGSMIERSAQNLPDYERAAAQFRGNLNLGEIADDEAHDEDLVDDEGARLAAVAEANARRQQEINDAAEAKRDAEAKAEMDVFNQQLADNEVKGMENLLEYRQANAPGLLQPLRDGARWIQRGVNWFRRDQLPEPAPAAGVERYEGEPGARWTEAQLQEMDEQAAESRNRMLGYFFGSAPQPPEEVKQEVATPAPVLAPTPAAAAVNRNWYHDQVPEDAGPAVQYNVQAEVPVEEDAKEEAPAPRRYNTYRTVRTPFGDTEVRVSGHPDRGWGDTIVDALWGRGLLANRYRPI